MHGVVKGFQSFNLEKDNELNKKIYQRNIPDNPLQPDLNIYPVQTKMVKMMISDGRKTDNVNVANIKQYNIHDVNTNFNPGTSIAPWNGYVKNIDTETYLRNPVCNLDINNVYVPDSNSDLYTETVKNNNLGIDKHNLLFHQEMFDNTNNKHVNKQTNKLLFGNNTRC